MVGMAEAKLGSCRFCQGVRKAVRSATGLYSNRATRELEIDVNAISFLSNDKFGVTIQFSP